ncbi:ABC transporter permease subunit [Mycoplasmopsis bovis]|uniref:Putative ABC transporter permease protein MG189 n=1 Tax=Mycoplasmopsis bovis TaxID=28903 RepID=A0A2N8U399_MYCBV|nr:ABC transporter permease subunit [Mycoplasmopsis bovis]AXJ70288.1 carbohydrate ABC transporter permease [Mycoplasmopsis bovis]MBT1315782.1 carbohydrate ABC transporter permease [Mycoplasmopsis bovis]MBT1317263.1 carbohydrate ABC transporter permease [Mycoplasmopsis bovis]MBT1323884.1 carbohydrate ABC transporter permease [Mycoplasmopsis bovis]MBT1324612.1 carbohydrate ABC transporter permease [Mycoplasmopsis bovis]
MSSRMLLVIFKEIIKYFLIGFLCLLMLFPLYYLLLQSLMSTNSLINNRTFLVIEEWNWVNFATAFKSNFLRAFGWTLLFATILILIRLIIYSLAIAGLLRMSAKYQKVFLYFFLVISLIPEFSIFLSLKTVLLTFNLDETPIAFVTNAIFSFFNFTYIFNLAKSISDKKNKTMLNDNLKPMDKLIYVYLPKMKLGYMLLIVFSFISVWNDYLWPQFLFSTNYTNISIWYLTLGQDRQAALLNVQAAGAFISIVIPLIIYFIFSKKISRFN